MQRRPSPTLAIMVLLAVMCAQVFGLSQGFVCICHGEALVTETSHCHSHSHSHESHTDPESDTHDHSEHKPLKKDLKAASLVKAPAAPDLMLAELPETFVIEGIIRPWSAPADRTESITSVEGIPPAALLVARCLVMRV